MRQKSLFWIERRVNFQCISQLASISTSNPANVGGKLTSSTVIGQKAPPIRSVIRNFPRRIPTSERFSSGSSTRVVSVDARRVRAVKPGTGLVTGYLSTEASTIRSVCTLDLASLASSVLCNIRSKVFLEDLHSPFMNLQYFCLAQGIVNARLIWIRVLSAVATNRLSPIATLLSVSAGQAGIDGPGPGLARYTVPHTSMMR